MPRMSDDELQRDAEACLRLLKENSQTFRALNEDFKKDGKENAEAQALLASINHLVAVFILKYARENSADETEMIKMACGFIQASSRHLRDHAAKALTKAVNVNSILRAFDERASE